MTIRSSRLHPYIYLKLYINGMSLQDTVADTHTPLGRTATCLSEQRKSTAQLDRATHPASLRRR